MAKLLVRETRGEQAECEHYGHICGLAASGSVLYRTGDPDYPAYMRSAGKPIQALPAMMSGAIERFGLTRKELAVMIGSHRAESYHVEALESMMAKIGVTEAELVCKPTYPLGPHALESVLRSNGSKRAIYHNCSGKHLGIIAYCKMMGYPVEGYWEFEHPAQQHIISLLAELAECPIEAIAKGIDGCGLPVYALPLRRIALAYMKFACPERIEDRELRRAAEEVTALMTEYPEMIAGTDRICTELLKDPNIVAKGGAKGIYCFALKREKLSFALKVLDGSEDEWPLIVASILEQIAYADRSTIERMKRLCPDAILNDNGREVGRNEAVFALERVAP